MMMLFIPALLIPVSARLIGVVELSRHGARTPGSFIQQWDNHTVWPQGEGELLPEGMRQHYLLGVEFRRRYMTEAQILLPNYYQPEIFVYSTDYNRTIMSAQSQIQGLYPSGTGPLLRSQSMESVAFPPIDISDLAPLNSTLGLSALPNRTQIIPIHSDDESRQWGLDSLGTCRYYGKLYGLKTQPSNALNEIWSQYTDVIQTIMQQMDYSENQAKSELFDIVDSLISNRFVNNPFPLGFNQSFFDRAVMLRDRLHGFFFYEPDLLARFSGTYLLNMIISDLKQMMIGNSTQKFYFYSAHDTSILCALAFLLLDYSKNPPFASTMLFELQEYDQQFYVNVKYNDILQNINGCQGFNCSMYDFIKFVEVRSIPNYFKACNQSITSSSSLRLGSSSSDSFNLPGHNNEVHLNWYFWVSLCFYISFAVVLCLVLGYISRKKVQERLPTEESLKTL